ncbi:hypothetical protein DFH27DRAFT_521669 [Peziza echinospora]|nr:hypothetical protein DFH27DRAFT_521669 [Peziza echinospora]
MIMIMAMVIYVCVDELLFGLYLTWLCIHLLRRIRNSSPVNILIPGTFLPAFLHLKKLSHTTDVHMPPTIHFKFHYNCPSRNCKQTIRYQPISYYSTCWCMTPRITVQLLEPGCESYM